MKKLALTIAIVLGLTMATFAQNNGGIFQRGAMPEESNGNRETANPSLMLPGSHGQTSDQSGPIGSGIAVLTALGAAYLVGKKRKED